MTSATRESGGKVTWNIVRHLPLITVLLPALITLSHTAASKAQLAGLLWASFGAAAHPQEAAAMERMGFDDRASVFEPLQSRALREALRKSTR